MITTSVLAICTLAALLAGCIDAVAGGGGLITLPALLLTGVPPHTALACNKVSACLGTATALGTFARSGLVVWRLAAIGAGFALTGSAIGSRLALSLDANTLGKVLIVLLPFAMMATLIPQKDRATPLVSDGPRFYVLAPLCCLGVGVYDGFFGPGTGTFLTLAFTWLCGMEGVTASGTSKPVNTASNLASLASFILNGRVLYSLALPAIVFSTLGGWVGSRLAVRRGAKFIRYVMLGVMGLIIVKLAYEWFA